MDNAERIWHILVLSLCATCGFVDLIILFTLLFKFYCQNQASSQTETKFEFSKKWTIIFILAAMATAGSDFTHLYLGHVDDDSSIYVNDFRFIITIADAFYFFYTVQLYVFLIYRVYSIFKDTEYRISKGTMFLFLALFIVNLGLMIYYLIVAIQVEHNLVDNDTFNPLLWIPLISMDILINVAIMTVMISKLRKIVVTTSIPDVEHSVNQANFMNDLRRESTPNALLIDDHGQTYVDIMSQFSVLSAIIVIFNQIFGAWLLTTVLLGESQSYSQSYINIIQFIGYGMRDVEGLVDCLVVYLTFKINENAYAAWCCCCHNMLQKLFMTNIQKQIKYHTKRLRNIQFSIDTLEHNVE